MSSLAHHPARRLLALLLARHLGGSKGGVEAALRHGARLLPATSAVESRRRALPPRLLEPHHNHYWRRHYFVTTFNRIVPESFRTLFVYTWIPTVIPGPLVPLAIARMLIPRP